MERKGPFKQGTATPMNKNKHVGQHRIVAKVDELMALCDQPETQLTTTQSESRHLLEAIFQQAMPAA